jgi:cyclophilin family peptidyl-prolyl cis-trans isomerase
MARTPIPASLGTLIALNLSAAALTGCGGASTPSALPPGCEEVAKPEPRNVDLRPPTGQVSRTAKLAATVDTSCGAFRIALDAAGSPKTVSSFAYLARHGVYDDTSFQRIVPGFVIQGGDPTATGAGGPGYSVIERPPPNTVYSRGTVAMAKAASQPPGGSGSQFFVVIPADAGLPPNYAVLGEVSSGWGVVTRIAAVGDPASGQIGTPRAPVAIRRITVRSR